MLIKNYYSKEVAIAGDLASGSKGNDVRKVQEWLNIWRYVNTAWKLIVTVDNDFGNQTKNAIIAFQQLNQLTANGKVNQITFQKLCSPMISAWSVVNGNDLRNLIVTYAEQHLANSPRELNNNNEGPWVRAYMDGNEGKSWAWCMGFVQSILDLSFNTLNLKFTSVMPHTYSCDVVGEGGKTNGKLIRNKSLRNDPSLISPGDVFLMVNTPRDWTHTGIIIKRQGDWIETVEGNTNDEGSREGFEVCRRLRDFMHNNIDIYKTA